MSNASIPIPAEFRSKKFRAAALASLLSFAGVHQGMPLKDIAMVIGPLLVYIGGQSLADFGKERVALDPETPTGTK